MAKYYRINLKDKEGNILYPNIHPNWKIDDATGNLKAENNAKLQGYATNADTATTLIAADGKRASLIPSDLTSRRTQHFFSTLNALDSQTQRRWLCRCSNF